MAQLTEREVLAAYNNAFPGGTNLDGQSVDYGAFRDYWTGKEDTQLKNALQKDIWAGGVYDSPEKDAARFQRTIDKLPPEYRSLYDEVKNVLDEIVARGQSVNPNVEITPEQTAKFLTQAQNEINPYYSTQLGLAKEGFLQSIGYDKQQILDLEKQMAGQFKQGFKQIGQNAADVGFAQSGLRNQQEQNLVGDTQYQIDQQRRALQQRTAELSQAYAQQYAGLPGYQPIQPTIAAAPKVTDQGFSTATGEKPIYSLSPNIYDKLVGEQEFNRRSATQTRASELESAFRTNKAVDQASALTI